MLPDLCKSCKKKNVCAGGCKAERMHLCKDVKKIDPYADIENINNEKFNQIKDKKEIYISNRDMLMVNEDIKYRKEFFGGLVFLSLKKFAAVDENLFNFLIKFKGKEIDFNLIEQNLKYNDEEVKKLVQYLVNKDIIKIIR